MPMDESRREIFEKLEEAVEQWGAQVSGAQQGLADELNRTRGRIEAAAGELSSVGNLASVVEELRTGLSELRASLAGRDAAPSGEPVEMEAMRAAVEALRDDVHSAVDALRTDLREVKQDLTEVRQRLALLPRLMEVMEHLASASSAPALPEAGQPQSNSFSNDAWQEVVRLRAQLEDADPGSLALLDSSAIERLAYDEEGHRRRMGEILVAAGVLEGGQLEQALSEQEHVPYRRLGSILIEKGMAPEEMVARVLAGQLRTRFVRLEKENIDPAAMALIGERMARQHSCIPLRATDDRLTLAIANPFDLIAIDDVEMASQRRVDTVVATPSDIEAAIQRLQNH